MSVENIQILLYILAGIGVILFLVATIMGHKSWKVHTIIMVFLIFMAASATMVFSVQALKAHQAWREILHGKPGERATGLIAKTEKLQRENQQLEFGKEDAKGKILPPGIAQLNVRLADVLYDRGRMWTDCKPESLGADDVVTVVINQQAPSQITENLILYVFDARPFSQGGRYLGMFRVTAKTGGAAEENPDGEATRGQVSVTLAPNWTISDSEEEQARLRESVESKQSWVMYDKMPVDGHRVFAKWIFGDEDTTKESEFDEMVQKAAEEEFQSLPEPEAAAKLKELTAMLKEFSQFDVEYESDRATRIERLIPGKTLEEFIDDHQPARDEHPSERIEELVEFQEDYPDDETNPRFVDGEEVWLPKVPPPEGVITIKNPIPEALPEEIQVESMPSIDVLVEKEIVERDDEESPRYSRKLRDYGFIFRDLYLARSRQQFQIHERDLDIEEMKTLLSKKQQVTAQFEKEKTRLKNDRAKFQAEQAIIERLLAAVEAQTKKTMTQMDAIRNETIQLGKRLNAAQMRAVEAINRRSPDSQAALGSG